MQIDIEILILTILTKLSGYAIMEHSKIKNLFDKGGN